jgi:hypothetical protein
MNTLATIHTKFQGETMFCFVCIATFFGYILGVNKVIECVVAKHSNNNIVIKTCNKYTQTNLNDLVEYLSSKNVIVEQVEKYSTKLGRSVNDKTDVSNDEEETGFKSANNDINEDGIKNENKNENIEHKQEHVQSPQSAHIDGPGSVYSNSNSEEDYEVVKKSENGGVQKHKIKFFDWFHIF